MSAAPLEQHVERMRDKFRELMAAREANRSAADRLENAERDYGLAKLSAMQALQDAAGIDDYELGFRITDDEIAEIAAGGPHIKRAEIVQ